MFCPKCGTQLPDTADFCMKCGTKIAPSAPAQTPSQSQRTVAPAGATALKCPSCGAPITPKFGEMIITCEYCGTSVALGNQGWKGIENHTMLPLKLASQADVEKEIHGMMDRGLLHRHLQEQSVLEEINLAFIPYWLVPVSARTSLVAVDMAAEAGSIATTAALAGILGAGIGGGSRGMGGGGLMTGMVLGTMMGGGMGGGQGQRRAYQMDSDYNYPVVALKALAEYQPKDYQFNLAERTLFDAAKVKGLKVMNGDVGEDTAKYQAKTMVDQLQAEKAHAAHHMIQQISTESDLGEPELLHAPVWFARYEHKGKKIVLVIDGNSSSVINSIGL